MLMPPRWLKIYPNGNIGSETSGRAIFVELKAPGKKPTPAQLRDHARRREMGFRVEVLDSIEAVDRFVEGL